jgi:hypothetical protein
VNATGTITVTPKQHCKSATTNIVYQYCINRYYSCYNWSSNGIGTATGLPAGVTAAFASNTITISGTPTSGTFNYTIPLTGGCGAAMQQERTVTQTTLQQLRFIYTNIVYQHSINKYYPRYNWSNGNRNGYRITLVLPQHLLRIPLPRGTPTYREHSTILFH